MTHDIKLPYRQTPRFPPRCVVCEAPNPGAIAEVGIVIAVQTRGLGGELVDMAFGGDTNNASNNIRIILKPAACPRCKPGLQRYHLWKQIWQYLGPLLGVAVMGLCLYKHLTFLAVVAVLAGVVLPVAYELRFPAAISATGGFRAVIYEFRSQRCAEEFAQLNQDPSDQDHAHPPDQENPTAS